NGRAVITGMMTTSGGSMTQGTTEHFSNEPDYESGDVLYKVLPAGQLDSSFGTSGALIINASENVEADPRLAALPGGKFYMVRDTGSWQASIERRNGNGTLDTSFGDAGSRPLTFIGPFPDFGIPTVQSDGKILLDGV